MLDPAHFAGEDALLREATGVAGFVRGTPRSEGVDAITLPGDPERRVLAERSANGIPIDDGHWARLVELAKALAVEVP